MWRATKEKERLLTLTAFLLLFSFGHDGGDVSTADMPLVSAQEATPEKKPKRPQTPPKEKPTQPRGFKVVVDENYRRPLWRRTPPSDSNNDKPQDVVKRFLESANKGDSTKAWKECRPIKKGGYFPSAGEKLFGTFCDKMRHEAKTVTLSGSTIKSKSGFWFIRYRLKTKNGQERKGTFSLIIEEKKWKISEKPHWRRTAIGEYDGGLGW